MTQILHLAKDAIKYWTKHWKCAEAMGFKTRNYDYYAGSAVLAAATRKLQFWVIWMLFRKVKAGAMILMIWSRKTASIYGRGVADDKGPTVVGLYALKCMKELGVQPNYTFRLVMGCSEETGMGDLPHYLEAEKMPTFAFTPDADFPVCIGEKVS